MDGDITGVIKITKGDKSRGDMPSALAGAAKKLSATYEFRS
jgi:hypothetical protein